MIKLDLQHGGQIRIWNQNLDTVKITSTNIIEEIYLASSENINHTMPINSIIIAEIFMPRGGRNIYGLLGLEYKKTNKKELKASIPISNFTHKKIFTDSLISKFDSANVGLQNEYSEYIFAALNELNKITLTGELNFCYEAFSEISSNGWIFKKLTHVLIQLLNSNLNEITKKTIEDELNLS